MGGLEYIAAFTLSSDLVSYIQFSLAGIIRSTLWSCHSWKVEIIRSVQPAIQTTTRFVKTYRCCGQSCWLIMELGANSVKVTIEEKVTFVVVQGVFPDCP